MLSKVRSRIENLIHERVKKTAHFIFPLTIRSFSSQLSKSCGIIDTAETFCIKKLNDGKLGINCKIANKKFPI